MRPRTVPSFYTFSQMVRLCQSPDPYSATGCRDRAILALLCSTGLRASELCGLRGHDFKGDRLFVHRGKFGHQRWVPISQPASRALHRYLVEHPPADRLGPVFRCVNGRGLTRRRLHKIVTGYSRPLGLEGGVHVLRSSAATRWLDQGVSLFHVQQALGHVRIATTARYLGAAVDGLVAAFRRCSVV